MVTLQSSLFRSIKRGDKNRPEGHEKMYSLARKGVEFRIADKDEAPLNC